MGCNVLQGNALQFQLCNVIQCNASQCNVMTCDVGMCMHGNVDVFRMKIHITQKLALAQAQVRHAAQSQLKPCTQCIKRIQKADTVNPCPIGESFP